MNHSGSRPASPEVKTFAGMKGLSEEAFGRIRKSAFRHVKEKGRFTMALSGGSTPRMLFDLFGAAPSSLPWPKTHLFWADERMTPSGSAASNFGDAQRRFLGTVALPEAQIHPMAAEGVSAEESAQAYEKV
ncbi:MAG: 6-phosphogluconolactonase, partial [Planctomycetota bacterium]